MIFPDYKTLSDAYEKLSNKQAEIGIWNSNFTGFKSMYSVFINIEASTFSSLEDIKPYKDVAFWDYSNGAEPALSCLVSNRIYADFFNQQGILQVGNEIIKIGTNQNWYIFDKKYNNPYYLRDLSIIPNLQSLNLPSNDGGDRASCATMYCKNSKGNHGKRVNGYKDNQYELVNIGGVNKLIFTGKIALSTKSYDRGIFGAWYLSKANRITIRNETSNTELIGRDDEKEIFFVSNIGNFTSGHTAVEDCGSASGTN